MARRRGCLTSRLGRQWGCAWAQKWGCCSVAALEPEKGGLTAQTWAGRLEARTELPMVPLSAKKCPSAQRKAQRCWTDLRCWWGLRSRTAKLCCSEPASATAMAFQWATRRVAAWTELRWASALEPWWGGPWVFRWWGEKKAVAPGHWLGSLTLVLTAARRLSLEDNRCPHRLQKCFRLC